MMDLKDLEALGINPQHIEDNIVEMVSAHMIDSANAQIQQKVNGLFDEGVKKAINAAVVDVANRSFTSEYTPTDRYGDKIGEPMTIRDQIFERSVTWFNQTVDGNGNPTDRRGYNSCSTMAEYITRKVIEDVATGCLDELKAEIKTKVADQIRENVSKMVVAEVVKGIKL